MVSVVISGWYGEKNLGDEIILQSMIDKLEAEIEGINITVMSFNPEYTKKAAQGVKAVRHFPYTIKSFIGRFLKGNIKDVFQTYRAIKKSNVILIGGGGFLSDWNPEAIKPWLRQIIFFKRLLKKKVMLYGIGAGPFVHDKYMKKVKKALDLVDSITVRDQKSFLNLKSCNITTPINITADPAVDLRVKMPKKKVKNSIEVGVSIAPLFKNNLWKNSRQKREAYLNSLIGFFNLVNSKYSDKVTFTFIPMQDDYDIPFNLEIMKGIKSKINFSLLKSDITNEQKIEAINNCDFLIGMRLHSIIIASTLNIPSLGIVYHHKVDEYIKNIGLNDLSVGVGDGDNWRDEDIDPHQFFENFQRLYENLSYYTDVVTQNVIRLKNFNDENVYELKKIIKKL